ncbi:MAG TPA: hypothetical protein VGI66_09900 [Streptosporangiaceae bacterium]
MGTPNERSLESIGQPDLSRLAELAAQAERRLFERHPDGSGRYAGRLLCRALCQGAARHYLDGTTGVKDFDVWSFYAERDDGPFPYRWRGTADFGPSKFGRYPGDLLSFRGRRVDFLGRSLPASLTDDPAAVVRAYLASSRTRTAKELAAKAVVLIDPLGRLGEVIWPMPNAPLGPGAAQPPECV